mgnify:CR=1 FL=1|uniref:NfeD family protein n=1 Tax=Gracilinema caldarium TaxID=215591 RepID=A0A7C3I1G3_9SPIR
MSPLIWLAIGIVIMALEAIVPGFILFWFGVAGVVTGLVTWLGLVPALEWQILIFFLFSAVLLILWFAFFARRFTHTSPRDVTIIGYRGKVIRAVKPMQVGEVELYDSLNGLKRWKAVADVPLEVDTEIEVIETSGIKLKVQPVAETMYEKKPED